ncbi:MAG: LacI family DNA-binding transcriptional regulator [Armatimonadota bacterium]
MRKLAKLAGVSPMTVSRALRGLPGLSEATRQRIQTLAEEYHYRPTSLAQGETTGTSRALGCILPYIHLSFYSRLLSGILQQAYCAEYRVIVLETFSDPERTRLALHSLIEHRVDGVLIDSEHPSLLSTDVLLTLHSHGVVPLCLDATPSARPVHAVLSDEGQLADLAVGYLHGLGHRAIAYLGSLPQGEGLGRQERPAAVRRALRRHGLSTDYLFDPIPMQYYGKAEDLVRTVIAPQVETLVTRLLALSSRPTAIITPSEVIAAYLLQALPRHGLRIPADISVLCMSNAELADCLIPPLTTIDPHPEELGRQAIAVLVEAIQQRDELHPFKPATRRITPHLIDRASCASPPRSVKH